VIKGKALTALCVVLACGSGHFSFAQVSADAFDQNGNPVVPNEIFVRDGSNSVSSQLSSLGAYFNPPRLLLYADTDPHPWYVVSSKNSDGFQQLLNHARSLGLRAAPDYVRTIQGSGPDMLSVGTTFTPSVGNPDQPCQRTTLPMPNRDVQAAPCGVAVLDTGINLADPYFTGTLWSASTSFLTPFSDTTVSSATGSTLIVCPAGASAFDAVAALHPIAGQSVFQPGDDNGHGTHTAGIVASFVKEKYANAYIMPIKITNQGQSDDETILAAISFIVLANQPLAKGGANANVKIVSLSWGGAAPTEVLYHAMDYAEKNGLLVICSAGNGHESCDMFPRYPANFNIPGTMVSSGDGAPTTFDPLDNILTVGSVDCTNHLARSSNYGTNSVDLAAFGERIICEGSDGNPWLFSGTSAAAARVSGAAASVLSVFPNLSPAELKWTLLENTYPSESTLAHFNYTHGVLDVQQAWKHKVVGAAGRLRTCPGLVTVPLNNASGSKTTFTTSIYWDMLSGGVNGPITYDVSLKSASFGLATNSISFSPPSSFNGNLTITIDNATQGLYFFDVSAHDANSGAQVSSTTLEVSVY